jgi:hypothetical protein
LSRTVDQLGLDRSIVVGKMLLTCQMLSLTFFVFHHLLKLTSSVVSFAQIIFPQKMPHVVYEGGRLVPVMAMQIQL